MSLIDLAGQFLGGGAQEGGIKGQMVNAVVAMLQNHPGGLQDLLGKFQANGMAEQVQSWIGTGANLPINAEQVQQALGTEQLESVARQAGVPPEHAGSGIAALLPDIINRLTPDGQVPGESGWQQALGGLLGKLLG